MERAEPTISNADLWAEYFRREWGRWLNPLGLPASEVTAATGARVAGLLSLVAAGPIAWLYSSNAEIAPPLEVVPRERPEEAAEAAA